jgi:hypothetical protein
MRRFLLAARDPRLNPPLPPSPSLSLPPTLMAHYYEYFTPSFLISAPQSTTTLKFISLSQLRLRIFLCCISSLVSECLRATINARLKLNYTIMLSWLWGNGLFRTFINLKSHSQSLYKSFFFAYRKGSLSFQRLNFRVDTQSTVKHETKHFPLRVSPVCIPNLLHN